MANLGFFQGILHNSYNVPGPGSYNVELTIRHFNVAMCVAYGSANGIVQANYFYFRGPVNGEFPVQSFPSPFNLRAGQKIWFFVYLLPQLDFSENYLINFGVGAGEASTSTETQPPEVAQIMVNRPAPQLRSALPNRASFDGALYQSQWAYLLSDLPYPATNTNDYQVNISDFDFKTSVRKLVEAGAVLFLLDANNNVRFAWSNASNLGDQAFFSRAAEDTDAYRLICLVKANALSGNNFAFDVGDPERDARVKIIQV